MQYSSNTKREIKKQTIIIHSSQAMQTQSSQLLRKMTCIITGHSRAAPEGVWMQGGRIDIPCLYDIEIQEEVSRDV